MASLGSVLNLIEEAKGQLLILMQEADVEPEPEDGQLSLFLPEWADHTCYAYELLTVAIDQVQKATLVR